MRGNWASYLYAPVDSLHVLQEVLADTFRKFGIDAKIIPRPHVSLSKVVTLQHHWIEDCVSNFRKRLSDFSEFGVSWESRLTCFVNEDKTRTFLGLAVSEASASNLSRIVAKVDQVLVDYKLEKFYDPPLFHVSLLWLLGDHRELIETNLKLKRRVDLEVEDFLSSLDDHSHHQNVPKLFFQSGHKVFQISLRDL